MRKNELVRALRDFPLQVDIQAQRPGIDILAEYLAMYFDRLDIAADRERSYWNIESYLPSLLCEAMEVLRTSQDPTYATLREEYEFVMIGDALPDLTSISFTGSLIDHVLTIDTLAQLMQQVTKRPSVGTEINFFFLAELTLINQRFRKFIDAVLRKGLYELLQEPGSTERSGRFGATTLRSYVVADRVMLTFARPIDALEESVSFAFGMGDRFAFNANVQSCQAGFESALVMLADVVDNWPQSAIHQRMMFLLDPAVALA